MSIEGQSPHRMWHTFKCDCGMHVRSVDFEQIDKFANRHSKKCHLPSAQSSSTFEPHDYAEAKAIQ